MASAQSLPVLYIRASSNYDVGFTIGSTFKCWIHEYLDTSKDVKSMRQYIQTDKGRQAYGGHLQATRRCYPEIENEIKGMADGSCTRFEEMFMLQMASEICFSYIRDTASTSGPKGCTDLLVNRKNLRVIGHNDDWEEAVAKRVFIIHVTFTGTSSEKNHGNKQFVSYMYPGYLAGFCFGMNKHLVITLNSLLPKSAARDRVPVAVLLRALLTCKSIEECVTVMGNKPVGCSYGMNINVAATETTDMFSVEVYQDDEGNTCVHTTAVPHDDGDNSFYHHENHYKQVTIDETSTTGSKRRESRVNDLVAPETVKDVRIILGDTEDSLEPVFQTPDDNHCEPTLMTSATAIINLLDKRMDVYRGNPKCIQNLCVSIPFL